MPTHLSVPLRLDGTGKFSALEQDGVDDVAQCVAVVLSTPVGSRIEVPDFGIPRVEFVDVIDTDAIVAAIQEWEPRADAEVVASVGLGDTQTVTVLTARVRPHI